MADETITTTGIAAHGASRLPSVEVDSFNIELKDEEGFLGDRASKGAFRDILDRWRKPLRKSGEDPFGKEPSENISKKVLDAVLIGDDTEASAVVHSAIEDFAQELAYVTRRFLKTKAWEKTERIVVGGGFRDSRLGELAIARTEIILKDEDFKIEMLPIRHHPDDAGLIGALHLAPSWIFEGHDTILAVDIGGTNIRCGVVETRRKKSPDLSKASVWKSELWRHADDEPSREEAVKRLVKLLKDLIAKADKEGSSLRRSSASPVPASSRATVRSRKARRTCPATGRAASSTCRQVLSKVFPRSGNTTRLSSCTTTAWCRDCPKSLSCRT